MLTDSSASLKLYSYWTSRLLGWTQWLDIKMDHTSSNESQNISTAPWWWPIVQLINAFTSMISSRTCAKFSFFRWCFRLFSYHVSSVHVSVLLVLDLYMLHNDPSLVYHSGITRRIRGLESNEIRYIKRHYLCQKSEDLETCDICILVCFFHPLTIVGRLRLSVSFTAFILPPTPSLQLHISLSLLLPARAQSLSCIQAIFFLPVCL